MLLLSGWVFCQAPVPAIYGNTVLQSGSAYYPSCLGSGVTLWTDSIYTSYLWSTGDTTPLIHIPHIAFYDQFVTLTVTNSSGTGSDSVRVIADIFGGPCFVGSNCPAEICNGNSLEIWPAGNPPLDSLVWNNGFTCITTNISPPTPCFQQVSTDGFYAFTNYHRPTGCVYQAIPMYVTVFDAPPTPAISQANDTLISSASPYGHYQWLLNGSPISGANQQTYLPTSVGSYAVEHYSIAQNCNFEDDTCFSAQSDTVQVVAVGLENQSLGSEISIYPHPANHNFQIQWGSENFQKLEILDLNGHFLLETPIQHPVHGLEITPAEFGMSPGIYLIRLSGKEGMVSKKVCIQ